MSGKRVIEGDTIELLANYALLGPNDNEVLRTAPMALTQPILLAGNSTAGQSFTTTASTTVVWGTSATSSTMYTTTVPATSAVEPVLTFGTTTVANDTVIISMPTLKTGALRGLVSFNATFSTSGTTTATSSIATATASPTIQLTYQTTQTVSFGVTNSLAINSINTYAADFFNSGGNGTRWETVTMPFNCFVTSNASSPRFSFSAAIVNNCSQTLNLFIQYQVYIFD